MSSEEESRAFGRFLDGFAFFPTQLKRAKMLGCYIEVLVLQVAFADALLRIALVLKDQLVSGTTTIDFRYLWQPDGTRNLSEKEVYRQARDRSVIDEPFYQELFDLFDQRNKAIHRLFISEIVYADLLPLSTRFDAVIEHLRGVVSNLERQQMETGVGMTVPAGPDYVFDEEDLKAMFLRRLRRDS